MLLQDAAGTENSEIARLRVSVDAENQRLPRSWHSGLLALMSPLTAVNVLALSYTAQAWLPSLQTYSLC